MIKFNLVDVLIIERSGDLKNSCFEYEKEFIDFRIWFRSKYDLKNFTALIENSEGEGKHIKKFRNVACFIKYLYSLSINQEGKSTFVTIKE